MAVKPAGQEEEQKTSESSGGASSPAGAEGGNGSSAAGLVPTAPAPVTTTQTVSSAPESVQAPPPATGVSTTTPGQQALTRTVAPASYESSTDAKGNTTTKQTGGPVTQTSAPAPATTTTKSDKKGDGKSGAGVSADPLADQAKFIQDFTNLWTKIAEGKDPVASAEWNSYIQMTSPKHQIAMEAMAMRLRQSGQSGPGAGDALMAMMARDLQLSDDQVAAQISAGSAKRLHDMNIWGIDKAMEMVKEEKNWQRQNFWDAVKAGQWDLAQSLGSNLFGVSIDVRALKASDPNTQTMVNNALDTMNQLISQGKADEAKALAMQLAGTNPEAFGFTDPTHAQAVVVQMDFKYEAWANIQKRTDTIMTAARNAALSQDWAAFDSAIENWASNQLPGAVDGMGQGIIKNESLDEINKYREAAGKTPITESERSSLSATEIAKDRQAYNVKNAAKGMNAVDVALDNLTEAIPELKQNPKAHAAARRWIAEQQAGISSNPIPPWDPASQTVHYYADWPLVYWASDGHITSVNTEFEIDEDSGAGLRNVTTTEGKRQQTLDVAYNQYLSNTPQAERLSAREWFYATKGGSVEVPKERQITTPGSTTPTDPGTVEPAKQEFNEAIKAFSDYGTWVRDRGGSTDISFGGKPAKITGTQMYDAERNANALVIEVAGKKILYDIGRAAFLTQGGTGQRYKMSNLQVYKSVAEALAAAGVS